MARKYRLATLGCKVNQYESQRIRELLELLGMHPATDREVPDLAIINTCAVTSSAAAKSRQVIRRIARKGCTSVIVVGCGVAADAERISSIDGVTATLDHSTDVCEELRRLLAPEAEGVDTSAGRPPTSTPQRPSPPRDDVWIIPSTMPRHEDGHSGLRTSNHSPYILPPSDKIVKNEGALTGTIDRFAGHQRAFIKVQDGCDAYCTYCIVPRLRPNLRYKPIATAVGEARALVDAGHREIVITGIFLGAYGRHTAVRRRFGAGPSPLAELVRALAVVDGLERLRLSSLEPGDVDDSLLEVLASHANCVPHLHLPLQSGSQDVLRHMNRQYTLDEFTSMIDRVKAALDRPAITTDIIVGFPGETEADFEASLEVARYAGFPKVHAFPFSPRNGTAAVRWSEQFVNPSVVRERMHRLADVERECSLAFRRRFIGQAERVLVEDEAEACPTGGLPTRSRGGRRAELAQHPDPGPDSTCRQTFPHHHGRSDRYFEVHFEAVGVNPGDLVFVRIDQVDLRETRGTLL
ncbi:MAG: MiaB/RimO family radical SAM methylthiotransferase [Phycisphaerales bacterium]|nr:MAG: MiaB/RimO family radical SAM methylthiotransferase [Phycisphaerales bacterium]